MSLTKVSYSMITGAPVNVYDYGVVGDGVADDTVALQAAVTAASGKQLWLGTGNFKTTATINLPQRIRMTGATNRSGNPVISAAFAGPALKYTAGSGTSLEMYLEHFSVIGRADLYGAGNGIEITNGSSLNMHSMVVAGFGTNQVNIGTGCYGAIIRDVYVAETYGPGNSNANLYCASEYCHFDKIESDDAKYSIYLAAGSYGTNIINCTLEGWSTTCIQINNSATIDRSIIQGNKLNNTRGGYAMNIDSNRCNIINNQIYTAPALASTQGIYLGANSYDSNIIGNHILGGTNGTAIWIENAGYTTVIGNSASGAYGIDIIATLYPSAVEGNFFGGTVTPAILRSSGTKLKFANNTMTDGDTTIKQPTVVGGTPTADFTIEFTPTLLVAGSSTGITYAANSQKGRYTKNGSRVFYDIVLVLTSKGSNAGSLTISGLPFASLNDTLYAAAGAVQIEDMAATAATMVTAKISQNSSVISLFKFATGTSSALAAADINNTTTIIISGQYLANTF